ncbi:MAG: hypothetical protein VW771_06460 [Gammaproteobacteria bacterium]
MKARRVSDGPIIHAGLDERIGTNINGPSLIRVPDWVERPLGRYYLYFAHHKGRFIRLAYADVLAGPWRIYQPGALDVSHSLFPVEDPPEPPVEERPSWANTLPGGYLYAHIASPDVHIDQRNQTIRMYYHGLLDNGDQQTRVAYSHDGLHFTPREPLLGPPYFRAFEYDGWIYAISWQGRFLRAPSWDGPFERQRDPGPAMTLFGSESLLELRHPAALVKDQALHLFFSCLGDRPERIYHACSAIGPDWDLWRFSTPTVLLAPQEKWEGADLPIATSIVGAAEGALHELRDPGIFIEGEEAYLLYSGAGEAGIGIARLEDL